MENKISIIIPVYNEATLIAKNVSIVCELLISNSLSYEIILIDDGSIDDTWNEIKKVCEVNKNITGIKLSRNFGKESAIYAGIDAVQGDACIIMDADLQHPPELIPKMVSKWTNENYDIVEGIKISRGKEKFSNKIGAKLFYKIISSLSGFNLYGASDFKLLDRKVINSLKSMREKNTFFRGMSVWTGYKVATIPFAINQREEGKSKWSILQLVKLAINAITSFSSVPLQLVTFSGILFLIASIVLFIQTLYMKFRGFSSSGFTTVIILLLIVGSNIMISLGIIGIYIAKIFEEVKARPRYLVSEEINKKA